MKISQPGDFLAGNNKIVDINGPFRQYLMDFSILTLNPGDTYQNDEDYERAYLLISGKINFNFAQHQQTIERPNYYDHLPYTIHLSPTTKVFIQALAPTEIAVFKTENPNFKLNLLRTPEQCLVEERGKGLMNETGTRFTRTIIDKSIASDSNFVLGEDMHHPGKWAGFPSHSHPQPEIYFYKFHPVNQGGFGLIRLGDTAHLLEENDTLLIPPNQVHPQVAAPGYAMYFIFAIRHLDGNPYIRPNFVKQHLWVEDPTASFWPYTSPSTEIHIK